MIAQRLVGGWRLRPALALILLCCATDALGVTLRYALVVGNNRGQESQGQSPPPLLHAEREARELRNTLVRLSNFDPSPRRSVLLTAATRAQVLDAARQLAEVRKQDEAALGEIDTLFAFFFTGHGRHGRLLLEDGPLSAAELGTVFTEMQADFTVGFFDACFSGSLELDALSHKGIEPTPGFNVFRELPEEVLTSEGSIWFASSAADQPSYEDQNLGGVFTHFFIEALGKADRDGPGITLDRIWHYARERTVEYTAARQRRQTPQQLVASLRSSGPLYFSFPLERSATLVFAPDVEGRFVLAYARGQLTELIDKRRGEARELAVYPGRARLMLIGDGEVRIQDELELKSGEQVTLRVDTDPTSRTTLGSSQLELWAKGLGERTLRAEVRAMGPSLLLGAGYELRLTSPGLLVPGHLGLASMRVDLARFHVVARGGYAGGFEKHASWGYQAHGLHGELLLGHGWDLGPTRLGLSAGLGGGQLWQRYDDGARRSDWYLQPVTALGVVLPSSGMFSAELALKVGALNAAGAGAAAGRGWWGWAGLALSGAWRAL